MNKAKRNRQILKAVALAIERRKPIRSVAASFGITRQRLDQIINPLHLKAREMVSKAIKSGLLIRPDSCQECQSHGKVFAHHSDYSKPLCVVFLCHKCHLDKHAEIEGKLFTFMGRSLRLKEWSVVLNIPLSTLKMRHWAGHPVELVLANFNLACYLGEQRKAMMEKQRREMSLK